MEFQLRVMSFSSRCSMAGQQSKRSIKSPKQTLLEVHQVYRAEPPKIGVQPGPPSPAPPAFLCTVVIPGICCKRGSLPSQAGLNPLPRAQDCMWLKKVSVLQDFQAEGSSKKAATHSACLKALQYIQAHQFLPPTFDLPDRPAPAEAEEARLLMTDLSSLSCRALPDTLCFLHSFWQVLGVECSVQTRMRQQGTHQMVQLMLMPVRFDA